MEKQEIFKEIIGDIINRKISFYGQILVPKICATGLVELSPRGEVVSINGDPKSVLEGLLSVCKNFSGSSGVESTISILKEYSVKYPDIKDEIDEIINKFQPID